MNVMDFFSVCRNRFLSFYSPLAVRVVGLRACTCISVSRYRRCF